VAKRRRQKNLRTITPDGRKLTAFIVEERQRQYQAGEKWALLDAADLCARTAMPMPQWLAQEFCDRYMVWYLFKMRSLDEAFGVERKGMRIEDKARRAMLMPRVSLRVVELHAQGVPVDPNLFDRVGEELEISGGLANSIFYDRNNHWLAFFRAQLKFYVNRNLRRNTPHQICDIWRPSERNGGS
jgi:hypothetical protein